MPIMARTLTRFRTNPSTSLMLAAMAAASLAGAMAGIASTLVYVERAGVSMPDVCALPPLDSDGVSWIIVLDEIARGFGRA